MKLQIAENISRLRKERGMTQEQLAQALGVTFAAVSKWERGVACPELSCIVEMADLFETSVDTLLGYRFRNNDRESTVKRLQSYKHNLHPGDLSDAERALKKYPNNFEVVHACASLYRLHAIQSKDEKLLRRALELHRQACLLIDQNRDSSISLLSIRIHMAELHRALGDTQTAVRILEKENPLGINNSQIGSYLAQDGRCGEAQPYLCQALLDNFTDQFHIVNGYLNICDKQEAWQDALDILRLPLATIRILRRDDCVSFLQRVEAFYLVYAAYAHFRLGQRSQAEADLDAALAAAREFDTDPSRDANRIRFVSLSQPHSGYDDLGGTGAELVSGMVTEMDNKEFNTFWEAHIHEKE